MEGRCPDTVSYTHLDVYKRQRYLSNLGKFALGVTDPFYPITVTPNTTITAVILSVSGETKQRCV